MLVLAPMGNFPKKINRLLDSARRIAASVEAPVKEINRLLDSSGIRKFAADFFAERAEAERPISPLLKLEAERRWQLKEESKKGRDDGRRRPIGFRLVPKKESS